MSVSLPPLTWRETPNQSARRKPVSLIVVHRWGVRPLPDELRTYGGVVNYLREPSSQASAHVVYAGGEENRATQLVAWDRKAWSCCGFNDVSEGIESADDIWFGEDPRGLRQLARIVAFRLHKRNLPARWIRGGALVQGKRGFTRHGDLGEAGCGHFDCPTTDDNLFGLFAAHVQFEIARGDFRPEWGR